MDAHLHVVDGVARLDLQSDGLAGQGLHEDLHDCVFARGAEAVRCDARRGTTAAARRAASFRDLLSGDLWVSRRRGAKRRGATRPEVERAETARSQRRQRAAQKTRGTVAALVMSVSAWAGGAHLRVCRVRVECGHAGF